MWDFFPLTKILGNPLILFVSSFLFALFVLSVFILEIVSHYIAHIVLGLRTLLFENNSWDHKHMPPQPASVLCPFGI